MIRDDSLDLHGFMLRLIDNYQIRMSRRFLDVLGDSSNESIAIFEVRIEVCLVGDRAGRSFNKRLFVRQGTFVQNLDIRERVGQSHSLVGHGLFILFNQSSTLQCTENGN